MYNLWATTKAVKATFGSHEKDPKDNSVEIMSEFVKKQVLPALKLCAKNGS